MTEISDEGYPNLADMSTKDLTEMLIAFGMSSDPSDRKFSKEVAKELAKRKPNRD